MKLDIPFIPIALVYSPFFNPLTPGAFCKKMRFLDILVIFRLDLGQISFNLAENAFAARQLAFLAIGIAFYNISFSPFLFLLYFSFCCSD